MSVRTQVPRHLAKLEPQAIGSRLIVVEQEGELL